MTAKILVVDDERLLVETITHNLQKAGFDVLTAFDGEAALTLVRETQPDLIVLDVMLPKASGWEVCRTLRRGVPRFDTPILMLTARGEESDKVMGLEMGADDYLVKPFGMRELMARVHALLRRAATGDDDDTLHIGAVRLSKSQHEVRVQDGDEIREVKLSLKEFELLHALMSQHGKAVPRQMLLERVWGDDFFGDERTLDVHIRWLREKLEVSPSQPQHILTVRGIGYKFKGA